MIADRTDDSVAELAIEIAAPREHGTIGAQCKRMFVSVLLAGRHRNHIAESRNEYGRESALRTAITQLANVVFSPCAHLSVGAHGE